MFFNYNSISNKNIELRKKQGAEFIGWVYIVMVILMLAFYRIVLFNGVSFG